MIEMPVKGYKGVIRIADTESDLASASNINYITDFSDTLDRNVSAEHYLGSADPALVSGPRSITITLTKMYDPDNDESMFFDWYFNNPDTIKYLGVYREGYASGKPYVVYKVMISNIAMRHGPTDITEITVTMEGIFQSRGTIA